MTRASTLAALSLIDTYETVLDETYKLPAALILVEAAKLCTSQSYYPPLFRDEGIKTELVIREDDKTKDRALITKAEILLKDLLVRIDDIDDTEVLDYQLGAAANLIEAALILMGGEN
jgi:hypothetical protein